MTLRKAILLMGVFGIFFAFACPIAPTPILVCKTFLLLVFVFALTLMSRSSSVVATVAAYVAAPEIAAPIPFSQDSSSVLLC